MTRLLSPADLTTRVARLLAGHGVNAHAAEILADVIVAAERDGSLSHGLSRLTGYVSSLRSGWVHGQAVPAITDVAPALVRADGANGFSQVALRAALPLLEGKARSAGVACLSMYNCHHFAALWSDIEPLAERGFVALNFVSARPRMAVWGSTTSVLGTNPMAFACPRSDAPPIVWDQASTVCSQGDVLIAARSGQLLAPGIGLDRRGNATQDGAAILNGGALLPFGGHKGGAIAFMVEIMAAALSGANFGFEDRAAEFPGAVTCKSGQTIMLIDPTRMAGPKFVSRVEELIRFLDDSGVARLPGSLRRQRRQLVEREGIPVSDEIWAVLES